jgi:hypothetical protein
MGRLTPYGFVRAGRKLSRYLGEPHLVRYDGDVWLDYRKTRRALSSLRPDALPETDRSQQVLIVSMTELPMLLKFHGLLALALRIRGCHPVVLLPSRKERSLRYLKLFGVDDVLSWSELTRENRIPRDDVASTVDAFWAENPDVRELKSFQYRGVSVGKHALSSAIRSRLRGQFDLRAPEQRALIRDQFLKAVESVVVAERLLATRPIRKMIVRDAGYVPNGGIYEVGLVRGIDCVRCEMA